MTAMKKRHFYILFPAVLFLLGMFFLGWIWKTECENTAFGTLSAFCRELSGQQTTEGQMWKIFGLEVFVLGVRPLALGILLSAIGTMALLKIGALNPEDFLAVMPAGTILAFGEVLLAAVVLAYFWGAAKLMKGGVAEALRDDG